MDHYRFLIPYFNTTRMVRLARRGTEKKTDKGLVMNYHSLAPEIYKRSVVIGMVHRIIRSCSS